MIAALRSIAQQLPNHLFCPMILKHIFCACLWIWFALASSCPRFRWYLCTYTCYTFLTLCGAPNAPLKASPICFLAFLLPYNLWAYLGVCVVMYPLKVFAQDCPCFYPFPLVKIGHQTLYLICFDIPRTILAASNLFPFVSNLHFSYLVSSSRCLGTCPLVLTMPIIITNNGAARFLPLPWYFLHTNHFARPLAPLSQIFHKWFHWPCVEQARFHI